MLRLLSDTERRGGYKMFIDDGSGNNVLDTLSFIEAKQNAKVQAIKGGRLLKVVDDFVVAPVEIGDEEQGYGILERDLVTNLFEATDGAGLLCNCVIRGLVETDLFEPYELDGTGEATATEITYKGGDDLYLSANGKFTKQNSVSGAAGAVKVGECVEGIHHYKEFAVITVSFSL